MSRTPRRHDADAGGDPELLAAKAALREEVWTALTEARAARFPGARNRISNFVGAEAAAERLRATAEWARAATLKANPDSAQLPVRQRRSRTAAPSTWPCRGSPGPSRSSCSTPTT